MSEEEHGKIIIFINDVKYEAPKEEMTGSELKQLANIPPGNRLFKEEPGVHEDKPIADNEVVHLRSSYKFYDLPPATFGD